MTAKCCCLHEVFHKGNDIENKCATSCLAYCSVKITSRSKSPAHIFLIIMQWRFMFVSRGWLGVWREPGLCWKRVSPFTLDAGAPQARGQIKLPHPPVSHAENMDLVRFINSYPPQRRMKLHHVSFRCSHKFTLRQAAVASITCILQLPLHSIQGSFQRFRSRIIVV